MHQKLYRHAAILLALLAPSGCANWPKNTIMPRNTVASLPGGATSVVKGFAKEGHGICVMPPGQAAYSEKLDNSIKGAYKELSVEAATKYETTMSKLFDQSERLLALQHVLAALCMMAENGQLDLKTQHGREFYAQTLGSVMQVFKAAAEASGKAEKARTFEDSIDWNDQDQREDVLDWLDTPLVKPTEPTTKPSEPDAPSSD